MKRFLVMILCCILLAVSIPVSAAENGATSATVLDNGIIVIDEVTIESANARATEKNATRTKTFYDGDTLIAVIAFEAVFRYDGTSVSVVSKSVTQTDTYSGWSFKQDSFTSSGGTVTLEGKLKWLLVLNSSSLSMTLSCDKNGNISYT